MLIASRHLTSGLSSVGGMFQSPEGAEAQLGLPADDPYPRDAKRSRSPSQRPSEMGHNGPRRSLDCPYLPMPRGGEVTRLPPVSSSTSWRASNRNEAFARKGGSFMASHA